MTGPRFDPYALRAEEIEEPPATAWRAASRLGPGMVLAASIVGSGELIATTTLGAQAGYVALWVVLMSCAVKPAVQAELGRYTVATGETGLEALDRVPGPRLGVSWILWAWAATVFLSLLQVGGMYGGLAQLMNLLVPGVPARAWALAFLALTLGLVLGGGYERVERLALVKVALFTLLTVLAAIVLTRQGEHFSWALVGEGLRFRLPATGFATAVAVYGITGVGATELFMYPYWCVEKGYARFVGPRDGSASRIRRARGWIRLMHGDIAASMVLYTLATVAFYLLGAGVLSPLGLVPSATDMIPTLSRLYTDTLGLWGLPLFYLGATVTLYGTIFAATAAHSRLYADLCRVMGLFERSDYARRLVFRRRFTVLLTVVPVLLYLLFESPVKMVVAGGISQSVMLPITGAGALYLHHRRLPGDLRPSRLVTLGLWASTLVMAVATGLGLFLTLRG
ncbi:MAG TPA: Nramp family divalent metal transporter [Vicinamibacteria bacterium]|nr:Nramp family divalent metal transporter [Vicinamibacteria bacterium]